MKTLALNVRSALLSSPEIGPLENLRRESVLFRQGVNGGGLFLIESGLVKHIRTSRNGSKIILSISGPHQLVGDEVIAQTMNSYLSDVICLTEVSGNYIPLAVIHRLLGVPEFAEAILSYVMVRDHERVNRIEMLTLYDVEQRLLHGLADLARLVTPSENGLSYPIPITQLEIAHFVGATRETTSTTLSNLQNRQLVRLGRRLITTVPPEVLIDAANGKLAKVESAT